MPRRREPQPRRQPPRIPLLLIAGVVVVVALAAFVMWPRAEAEVAADPSAPARLVATNPAVDLGRVPLDVPVEARFALVNTGGHEVRLIGRPTVKTLEGC